MDKKRGLIIVSSILLVLIGISLVFKIEKKEKEKLNDRPITKKTTTTTTKTLEKIEFPITNETLLKDCNDNVCKEVITGNIRLQVKNYQLYVNNNLVFGESGSMEYDDQLYYEINYMDDNNLFFDVTFGGERVLQYIIDKNGRESIKIDSLGEFEYNNAEYKDGYLTIYSTSEDVMNIINSPEQYCENYSTYDDIKIVNKEIKYKYLGNGRVGNKEVIVERTLQDKFMDICTATN